MSEPKYVNLDTGCSSTNFDYDDDDDQGDQLYCLLQHVQTVYSLCESGSTAINWFNKSTKFSLMNSTTYRRCDAQTAAQMRYVSI